MNINASLFVQMVVFFIGCWITMKFIWPPLIKAIEERQNKIAQGLAAADGEDTVLRDGQDLAAGDRRVHIQGGIAVELARVPFKNYAAPIFSAEFIGYAGRQD